jgi:GNAT superfamily N-acetyltransferase
MLHGIRITARPLISILLSFIMPWKILFSFPRGKSAAMNEILKRVEVKGYLPGAIGRVVELHASYYSRHWGFGPFFEAKVAAELSEFISRFQSDRDGFWTVCMEDRVKGSIVIDGLKHGSEGAHLRWFILSSDLRGCGIGCKLMEQAVGFCRAHGYRRVYLWTFEGLTAARHLYEKFGFTLVLEREGEQWGTRVKEQKFLLKA